MEMRALVGRQQDREATARLRKALRLIRRAAATSPSPRAQATALTFLGRELAVYNHRLGERIAPGWRGRLRGWRDPTGENLVEDVTAALSVE